MAMENNPFPITNYKLPIYSSMEPQIQGPVFLIDVDKIKPNPYQPRREFDDEQLKELAQSIREFGVIQPIVVTKVEKEVETGTDVHYELIAGERRWLASKMVGLERIPAVIRHVQVERERLELAIIENVQRANLSPIESARAYARLQDEFKLTQREIASRIGKSREVVANTLRLLNLPSTIQDAISKNLISESQARLLLTLETPKDQEMLFQELLLTNMSVRDLRLRIQKLKDQNKEPVAVEAAPAPNPEVDQLKAALEEFLGARVKVKQTGENGELAISFYSLEELRTILEKILPHHEETSTALFRPQEQEGEAPMAI